MSCIRVQSPGHIGVHMATWVLTPFLYLYMVDVCQLKAADYFVASFAVLHQASTVVSHIATSGQNPEAKISVLL